MAKDRVASAAGPGVRFRLLGPFAVYREGVALAAGEIGSRKGRTLLKLLLLERGHVVPGDRIAEVLWEGDIPPNADRLVATLVSRLRGILGTDAIDTVATGYRLVPSSRLGVDLEDAERLAAEAEARWTAGDASLALTAAERAIELLEGGEVLEDEPYADWAEGSREGARRLLHRARRSCWLAATEVGDLRAALVAGEGAVDADPLDEEARRAVMATHYRDGRPARALEEYERLRRVLVEELGTDPAPETQDLHLAILRDQPLQTAAEEQRADLPLQASDPGFVGRDEEVSLVSGLWRDAARGHQHFVLLAGEAGIGKTRLAHEVVRLAERTGGLVAQARCYEAERSLFLQPLADAIRSVVASSQPDLLREVVGPWAGTLAEIVPEVGLILRPHRYDRATPEIERRRSFEAVIAFIRALGEHRPVLVFLDDLHHAGSSTLELLHFAARRLARARLLVLATIRVEEGEEALSRMGDVARRVEVGPLAEGAVTELAQRMGGAHLGGRIVEMTRGHPLFVVEMLRAVAERAPGSEDQPVPESLRTAVLERVRRTGPDVEELLRVSAVLGSAFELPVAARMLDLPVEEAGRRAERARVARLLVEAETSFEFANDLIKEILYRTTPHPILVTRHKRAASLLAENPEAVAAHAGAAGDLATAMEAWMVAASRASAKYANRDADVLLTSAIEAALALEDRAGEARARLARGHVREALASYAEAHADHRSALDLAREVGDRTVEMQALRELGGDVLVGSGKPTRDGLPSLEMALPIARELGDVRAQVDVLSRLAVVWTNRLRFDRADEYARQAVELARASGDEGTLALALDGMKSVSAYAGDLETLEALLPELEVLLRRAGDLRLLHWTLFESSLPAMARGEWDETLRRIAEALDLTERTGYHAYQPWFLAHRGWVERSRGRYGEAVATGRRAVEIAERVGHPWWEAFAATMLGWSLQEAGSADDARSQLERGLRAAEREGSETYLVRSVAHLALVAQLGNDDVQAGRHLGRAETILRGITARPGGAFLHGAHGYAAAARAALARREAERAERLIRPILDAAGPAGWREAAAEAAMLTGRARLATNDVEGAATLLRRSLEEMEGAHFPRVAWEAHAALAEALAATGVEDQADAHRDAARTIIDSLAASIEDEGSREAFLATASVSLGAGRR